MNSPAGMSVISIFTPPPKSTVIFSGPAAAFFAGPFTCPHALAAIQKSTTHAARKVFITCTRFFIISAPLSWSFVFTRRGPAFRKKYKTCKARAGRP